MLVVHAADLHIDSPLAGLGRLSGLDGGVFRLATRRAFTALIDLCLQRQADVLLLAGDVFDGSWKDWNTGLFFVRELGRLAQSGTRVVMLRGNHDAASIMGRQLTLPDFVHVLPDKEPGSVVFDDVGVAVHGQGYARREVFDNLAAAYPAPLGGLLNIGLLHTAATGAAGGDSHQPYAPCTADQLAGHGYALWALGHVHRRQMLGEEPWIAYPGNLQGRHPRETGAKGCLLWDWDGKALTPGFEALDVARWEHLELDVSGAARLDDVLAQAPAAIERAVDDADGRPLALRITLQGQARAHDALLTGLDLLRAELSALAAAAGEVAIERVRVKTTPPSGKPPGELLAAIEDELRALADEGPAAWQDELQALRTRLQAGLGEDPLSPERVGEALERAAALLRTGLGGA